MACLLKATSGPARGRFAETSLGTVLLHKSPLASGFTVTACVSWERTVYIYLVCGCSLILWPVEDVETTPIKVVSPYLCEISQSVYIDGPFSKESIAETVVLKIHSGGRTSFLQGV